MAFTNPVTVKRNSLAAGTEYTPTDKFVVITVASGTATFQSRQGSEWSPLTVINAATGAEVTSGGAGAYIAKVPAGSPVIRATGASVNYVGLS